jgi:Domain of unknown function (DUF5047)
MRSHIMVLKIEVVDALGNPLVVWTSSNNQVVSGEITVQTNPYISRAIRVTVPDPDGKYIPTNFGDLLWFNRTCIAWRGIRYDDGSEEYIRLGTFRISTIEVTSTPKNRLITLRGIDNSDKVSRAKFTDGYKVAKGTNIGTAIQNIIAPVGSIAFGFETTTSTAQQDYNYLRGDDRWLAAQDLATGIGYELFFDEYDKCRFRLFADPTTASARWRYSSRDEDALKKHPILELSRVAEDSNVYNHVIVTGESDSNVVVGEAYDNDARSPTYRYGPMGDIPYFTSQSTTQTNADAQAMAARLLHRYTRVAETITMTHIPNAALQPGDVINVSEPRAKISGAYFAGDMTIPLDRDVAQTTTLLKQLLNQ